MKFPPWCILKSLWIRVLCCLCVAIKHTITIVTQLSVHDTRSPEQYLSTQVELHPMERDLVGFSPLCSVCSPFFSKSVEWRVYPGPLKTPNRFQIGYVPRRIVRIWTSSMVELQVERDRVIGETSQVASWIRVLVLIMLTVKHTTVT